MPSLEQSYLRGSPDKLGLEPVTQGGAIPPRGGPGGDWSTPTAGRFLATPLPLIATYQPDALRQFYRGGVPQQRIFPSQRG